MENLAFGSEPPKPDCLLPIAFIGPPVTVDLGRGFGDDGA
jgi:hypothetical protein